VLGIAFAALFSAAATAQNIVAPFTDKAAWSPLLFKKIDKHTVYKIEGETVHAIAEQSASALSHKLTQAVSTAPILRFKWKVGNVIEASDPREKAGDDYPARLYVSFIYTPEKMKGLDRVQYNMAKAVSGEFPPHGALNYIVSDQLPIGSIVDNPYSNRVKMIVVDSAKGSVGQWKSYERNVLADYRKAFSEDPPAYSGIAIMSDTDNTQSRAEAWFGAVSLSPN
jgi:Protein of unknown function (DUF3047)